MQALLPGPANDAYPKCNEGDAQPLGRSDRLRQYQSRGEYDGDELRCGERLRDIERQPLKHEDVETAGHPEGAQAEDDAPVEQVLKCSVSRVSQGRAGLEQQIGEDGERDHGDEGQHDFRERHVLIPHVGRADVRPCLSPADRHAATIRVPSSSGPTDMRPA
jgi:hypothetical protein